MSVGGEEMNAPVSMANVFTATSDETLKAVSFYTTDANAQYSIQVYTQLPEDGGSPIGEAKAYKEPITGTEAYPGYHTIYLDEDQWVNLAEGEKYSIVVTMENPLGSCLLYTSPPAWSAPCSFRPHPPGRSSSCRHRC